MNAPVSLRFETGPTGRALSHPAPDNSAVLITGGAQRIGAAIARHLAKRGWPVVIHFNRSAQTAMALGEEIAAAGGRAELLHADLSAEDDALALIERAERRAGPIGVLINNASIFEWDDIACLDEGSFARHMDLNLRTPLTLTQHFAESLAPDRCGAVINMLDSRVLNPTPRHLSYTLSKTGLATATRSLAQALAPQIRVNGIGPGPTLPVVGQTPEQFEQRCQRLPLKRPAALDEICQAVDFLIGARSVTGQIIALDGGDHLLGHCPAI